MNLEPSGPERARPRPLGVTVFGLLIVLVGLAWLAGNLGFDVGWLILRRLWPTVLVVLGLVLLLQRRSDRVVPGLVLLVGGLWVWVSEEHLLSVSFWALLAPVLLVLVGASVVWRAFTRTGPEAPTDAYVRLFCVFAGNEIRPTLPFEGADLTAVMGAAKLDLTRIPMARESATIDVFLLMGGGELLVPPDWDVTLQVFALMGGCVDKRRPPLQPPSHHLIVRGLAVMGGLEIKDF